MSTMAAFKVPNIQNEPNVSIKAVNDVPNREDADFSPRSIMAKVLPSARG